MTNNRTDELRKMLDERGVKYQAIGKTLTYWNRDGSDNECDDADFVADERPDGTLTVEGLAPEQAVAATLESEREKALEELVRDAYWLIVRATWTHVSQDKFAAEWTERVSILGIEVD